jgi:hypothetical protein
MVRRFFCVATSKFRALFNGNSHAGKLEALLFGVPCSPSLSLWRAIEKQSCPNAKNGGQRLPPELNVRSSQGIHPMDMTGKPHNTEDSLSRSVARGAGLVQDYVYSRPDTDAQGTNSMAEAEAWARHAAACNGFGDAGVAPQDAPLSRMAGQRC